MRKAGERGEGIYNDATSSGSNGESILGTTRKRRHLIGRENRNCSGRVEWSLDLRCGYWGKSGAGARQCEMFEEMG